MRDHLEDTARERQPLILQRSANMSLILRHKPEVIGTQLDAHGWADVNVLLAGIGKKYPINRDILEEIVRSDSKQRYAFNEDRTLIRANQGHSIQMDVGLPVTEPPETLHHGTAQRFSAGGVLLSGAIPIWATGRRRSRPRSGWRRSGCGRWPGRHRFRPMSFFEDPNLRELLLEPESLRRIREAALIDNGSLIRK